MLAEIAPEQLAATLDEVAGAILAAAGIVAPPVDALYVAQQLDMLVARDDAQRGRARCVKLRSFGAQRPQSAILVRSEPRPERLQWSVAHEIGEHSAAEVFAALGVAAHQAAPGAREQVANLLAGRLLLPTGWFGPRARRCRWDLMELKAAFPTASHELIARRMLDFEPEVVITVFDQGAPTWRRTNAAAAPPLTPLERRCRQRAAESGEPASETADGLAAQCWPVHEPCWQREILRAAALEVWLP